MTTEKQNAAYTPMYVSDIRLVDYPKYKGKGKLTCAILGIPFDQAVCNRPGARFAPRAIRLASAMHFNRFPYGWEKKMQPHAKKTIYDLGDIDLDYGLVGTVRESIYQTVTPWVKKGVKLASMGGDHSISYPLIKAYSEHYQKPIALIQFDSHSDTWADEATGRVDHGSMFYHAVKEGYIDHTKSVQIGIRSYNEDPLGICTLDNNFLHQNGIKKTIEKVKKVVGNHPAYVSFDIDFIDPAFAPGTGTPVCGGFSTYQTLSALEGLLGLNIIGGDVVELNPAYDHGEITAIAAASILQALSGLLLYQS